MEDPHFSYSIFHGNTTRELATPIRSTLKVPDGLPKAKGLMKAETVKKPLCDVGNTLVNVRKVIKSLPEDCTKSSLTKSSSFLDLKGLPDCGYQCDEVFSDEANVCSWEPLNMIDLDESLDPVPKPNEDNYEDIIPRNKDISPAAIHKMMYLWEQYDIPCQSSPWEFSDVENTVPLPESPATDQLLTAELFAHIQELPVPNAVPLVSF